MVKIYRFPAVRPAPGHAQGIAAVPYDVVNADEARECIRKNPESFLRVSRSDALLPDRSPYDESVYSRARDTFREMIDTGEMVRDEKPSLYLYRVTQGESSFLGLVACMDVDDYQSNQIRRHEATRYDKEEDRTRHIDAVNAHTGPVVLLYRDDDDIFPFIESLITQDMVPDSKVCTENGSVHEIFSIGESEVCSRIIGMFAGKEVYIADGHHRAKSAVNVAGKRKIDGVCTEEAGHFMGVLFPHRGVAIHGYSRLVVQPKKLTPEAFIAKMDKEFHIRAISGIDKNSYQIVIRELYLTPHHVFHMYINGMWYECASPCQDCTDPVDSLDVSVLQKEVLQKIFGITDPRGDMRLQYLGGARPIRDLEDLVDRGDFMVAFSMQPVDVDKVLEISDKGFTMPPKSTWFEPKLLSGLLVHVIG